MEVSKATIEDIREIAYLGKAFHAESPHLKQLPFSLQDVAAFAAMFIRSDKDELFIVRDPDSGKIIGGLFAAMEKVFFGPATQAVDHSLYVSPDRRGAQAATVMLVEFIDWAWRNGAARIIVSNSSGIATHQFGRFLERFGFKPQITGYVLARSV